MDNCEEASCVTATEAADRVCPEMGLPWPAGSVTKCLLNGEECHRRNDSSADRDRRIVRCAESGT